jgi:hypothetical protein
MCCRVIGSYAGTVQYSSWWCYPSSLGKLDGRLIKSNLAGALPRHVTRELIYFNPGQSASRANRRMAGRAAAQPVFPPENPFRLRAECQHHQTGDLLLVARPRESPISRQ